MQEFGLNHMTVPAMTAPQVVQLAASLGCTGVEFRNDLASAMFATTSAREIADQTRDAGLTILALAEVQAFNTPGRDFKDCLTLIKTAAACGAKGVALIPQVATSPVPRDAQRAALRDALTALQGMLADHGIVGLIEPLGFASSSLRLKADVVAVLDDLGRPDCFAIIHDTFHHHLSGEAAVYAPLTDLVHISGVTRPIAAETMTDADRVLVDGADRLGNVAQLRALTLGGYAGAASFEAFAPEIHNHSDPAAALAGSIAFISSQMAAEAA